MRRAIAIDFDGTICTNAYPNIGEPKWALINEALKQQKAGAGLILWTCREGVYLSAAVAACESWGLHFDGASRTGSRHGAQTRARLPPANTGMTGLSASLVIPSSGFMTRPLLPGAASASIAQRHPRKPSDTVIRERCCVRIGSAPAIIGMSMCLIFAVMQKERKKKKMASLNEKVRQHAAVCNELNALFARKNADYGDAFHTSFLDEGLAMARIRLGDKLARFKNLSRSNVQMVSDESIRDTLIDLANYAVMTVMELDNAKQEDAKQEDANHEGH